MQRALMGKGGRRKLRRIEKVEGGDKDESEDEDAMDDQRSGKGKKRDGGKVVDEKTWKPRVYKWKLERRR
jgi:U3 small nucleolar RNA-associated protein 11